MKRSIFSGAIATLSLGAATASASLTLNLGGGWEAEIVNPDRVDVVVDFVSLQQNILVIQKFADFLSFSPEDIIFRQIASDAQTVTRIVITEEFVFNNTGSDWPGFRMDLLGGEATFNPADSADFSINPFTSMTFFNSDMSVLFDGGVVESGSAWNPGFVSGGLVINVDLSSPNPVEFTLREFPIPAPGALALLLLAGGVSRGRARRR